MLLFCPGDHAKVNPRAPAARGDRLVPFVQDARPGGNLPWIKSLAGQDVVRSASVLRTIPDDRLCLSPILEDKMGTQGSPNALHDAFGGFGGRRKMGKLSGIELKRARLVPSSVFASPDEVVSSAELSQAQKIAILRRWEFDARGAEAGVIVRGDAMLEQVRQALAALGAAAPRPPVVTRH